MPRCGGDRPAPDIMERRITGSILFSMGGYSPQCRRHGDGHLDPAMAYYTNRADDPNPQPHGLASQLIAEDRRAILVVDHSPQELHRRLSELCRSANSKLSVLTVELDISEDQPEGTSVFRSEERRVGKEGRSR